MNQLQRAVRRFLNVARELDRSVEGRPWKSSGSWMSRERYAELEVALLHSERSEKAPASGERGKG